MPPPVQAFLLDIYADSATTDTPTTPQPAFGQAVPASWGTQGIEAWRQEWRVAISPTTSNPTPNPPDMAAAVRMLRLKAVTPQTNYYAADGNALTINIWDVNSTSTISNAVVVVTGYYYDTNGDRVQCPPPFSGYAWNPGASPTYTTSLPSTGSTVQFQMAPGSQSLNPTGVQADPDSTVLYSAALLSLLFNSTITPAAGTKVGVAISVYFQLTTGTPTLSFYADPELEVDCGTGGGAKTAAAGA